MNLNAICDKVILKGVKADTVSEGGIILGTKETNEQNQGQVVSAGPDCQHVKADDVVIFNPQAKFSKHEDKAAGEVYLIMQETDLLAIIE